MVAPSCLGHFLLGDLPDLPGTGSAKRRGPSSRVDVRRVGSEDFGDVCYVYSGIVVVTLSGSAGFSNLPPGIVGKYSMLTELRTWS